MASTLSKLWTRASFAKNCGEAVLTGGKSEFEEAVGGASCARSTMQLLKQECEDENIPKPLCPPEWRPDNKIAEERNPRRTDSYVSEPVIEEKPVPKDFQRVEIGHTCPECGTQIESQAVRCNNCHTKLDWQFGIPKGVEEKMSKGDESPSIAVQSKSSF